MGTQQTIQNDFQHLNVYDDKTNINNTVEHEHKVEEG